MPVQALTGGPQHHFFGYYDKCPWDEAGRLLLAQEVDFFDRPPTPADAMRIGVVDLETGRFGPVAETTAWCWQQGTMLQWLPGPGRRVVFNERRPACARAGGFGAVVLDLDSGARRQLPRSIYAVRPDGGAAVCINHARLAVTRPGYGYVGQADPWEDELHPEEDGVWWLDLETGQERLVFSLAQAARVRPRHDMAAAKHWFNHLQFCPDGSRFLFLHRYLLPGGGRRTRLFTSDPAGTDVRLVADDDMVSHFDWRDATTICAWARQHGRGDFYYLFDDADVSTGARPATVGEGVLTEDGHCSFAHGGRWMLTDTYPDSQHRRTLILWDMERRRRIDLGRFDVLPEITGEIRCDLHPRWSRDGTQVCFDSVHEGTRQIYAMDVAEHVRG